MVTIRTSQQSQMQEFTSECTKQSSTQFAPPTITRMKINSVVRGQRRRHLKGVRRQLNCVPSSRSTAAGTSTPTPVHPPIVSSELWHEFIGIIKDYHQYVQDFLGFVMPRVKLPPMPPFLPRQCQLNVPPQSDVPPQPDVPPQQDRDNDIDDDVFGPTNFGDNQIFFFWRFMCNMTILYVI